jgi:hypothetical protein
MPNLNEFFHKPEIMRSSELEPIPGVKPCGKCEEDAQEAFWDPSKLILSWECPNGHPNQIKVG